MAEMRSFIGKHGLKLLLTISVTFLLVFMILPILDMFTKSVVDDNGFTWSYFKEFFSKSLYAKILLNTIRLSLIIGLVTIVLGYPVAYLMNHGMCTDSILDEPACTNLFLDRDTAESGSG